MAKASEILKQAKAWLGKKESDGSHKVIIDTYNKHKPLARGYKVKYNDAWCATYVSAVSIVCDATDIIPTECGCGQMIELFKKLGVWVENENRTPNPGDIIFYDWDDSGKGDNTGWPEHVGIVEKVTNGVITVIEGNYNNAVKRREIKVNAKNIRGFATPKYDKETVQPEKKTVNVALEVLRKGSKGEAVASLQALLIAKGYSCGKSGIDGDFGNDTEEAVELFQKANGLEVDGVVGVNTWTALIM